MRNAINGTERSEPGGEPVPSAAGAQILTNITLFLLSPNGYRIKQLRYDGRRTGSPSVVVQITPQVTPQLDKVVRFCSEPRTRDDIQNFLMLKDR